MLTILTGTDLRSNNRCAYSSISDLPCAEFNSPAEDSYRKHAIIDDQPCLLEILDTAGQGELAATRSRSAAS